MVKCYLRVSVSVSMLTRVEQIATAAHCNLASTDLLMN